MSGEEVFWLEGPLSVPALSAKASFMAGCVPSMMQGKHVMKNDDRQWFGARTCSFITFLSDYYICTQHFPIRFFHSLATGVLVYLLSRRHD